MVVFPASGCEIIAKVRRRLISVLISTRAGNLSLFPQQSTSVMAPLGSRAAFAIPRGLCISAQGCERRATLGSKATVFQPQRGCVIARQVVAATPLGLFATYFVTQGSSFLATLGYTTESLRDSSRANRSNIAPLIRDELKIPVNPSSFSASG